MLKSKKYC